MRVITMTLEQTRRYDNGDVSIIAELRAEASRIREPNETVEIYTADGIVADVIQD